MTSYRLYLTAIMVCASIAPLVLQTGGASNDQAGRPNFVWSLGPFKLALVFKTPLKEGKLRLNEMFLSRYLIGYGEKKADKILTEQIYRRDLANCKSLFEFAPEVDSLIDCRPLIEHLREEKISTSSNEPSHSIAHVERTLVSLEHKAKILTWLNQRHSHQFYPFQRGHTKLMIDRIITSQNLTRSRLGFDSMSPEFGFFVVSSIQIDTIEVTCTSNVFVVANQTEPAKSHEGAGAYPEAISRFGQLIDNVMKNGGILSIRDANCKPSTQIGNLKMDLTLIYRKQFPYVSYEHSIKIEPFEKLWNSQGSIKQVRSDSNPDAYNTSIDFQSLSSVFDFLNYKLLRDVVSRDPSTGSDFTFLLPGQAATYMSKFNWDSDSLKGDIHAYSQSNVVNLVKGLTSELGDPNMMLEYVDEASSKFVDLRFRISREILISLLEKLGVSYKGATPKEPKRYHVDFDSLPFELQHQLRKLADEVTARDEL